MGIKPGALPSPVSHRGQCGSEPIGMPPGKSCWPWELVGPRYHFSRTPTSASVRQSTAFPPLHWSDAGLNSHLRGSEMMRSFKPSLSSHATYTASCTSFTFDEGKMGFPSDTVLAFVTHAKKVATRPV